MSPRVGLDGREISSHRVSLSDRPARSSVVIPTELPGPLQELNVPRLYANGTGWW